MISWVAAHKAHGKVLASAPHTQPSSKGFDAVLVELNPDMSLKTALICEDKATTKARRTIVGDVWPSFTKNEQGINDSALLSDLTAILERFQHPDVDRLIQGIHWKQRKAYRVCITVARDEESGTSRASVFDGYDVIITGTELRRRAETIFLPKMRKWMSDFCELVSAELRTM